MTVKQQYYGTGRRKGSVARVFLRPGTGKIVVNTKDVADYFGRETLQMIIKQPFKATNTFDKFDIYSTVKGGGCSGQAGAIRLGLARALVNYDETENPSPINSDEVNSQDIEENAKLTFRKQLRLAKLLTRDSRVVERKKIGRHKARKKPQYSKR